MLTAKGQGSARAAHRTRAPVETLLERLERVRQTGPNSWIASCPHGFHNRGDRNPGLSVAETADGAVIMHCHAGCSTLEILEILGLEFRDLYPQTESHHVPGTKAPFPARHVLSAISHEALVAAVGAENVAQGVELTDKDRERLIEAAKRLREGAELGGAKG